MIAVSPTRLGGLRSRHGHTWRVVSCLGLAGALLLTCALSLLVGARPIPPRVVLDALLAPDKSEAHYVVTELRVPRTLLGLLVGAALAVGGALIQALTRNPLADPGILGVNAGAGTGVVIASSLFGVSAYSGYVWWALGGAIVVTVVVYAIGSSGVRGDTPLRMTLVGVAVGSVLSGVGSAVALLDPATFDQTRFWAVGTLNVQGLETVQLMAPFLAAGLLCAAAAARPLNAISFGEDIARTLGVNLRIAVALVVAGVTLLCGAATAAVGPIAFVGFMIPHVARWIVGPNQPWIFTASALLGAMFLLASDIVGRIVLPSGELPVGLVTVAIGAPVLIVIVRRWKLSGL